MISKMNSVDLAAIPSRITKEYRTIAKLEWDVIKRFLIRIGGGGAKEWESSKVKYEQRQGA